MSTLFRQHEASEMAWQQLPLAAASQQELPFRLFPLGQGSEAAVVLLVPLGVAALVNGEPLLGGLRVLAHRDEILVGGRRFYYSAQSKPAVSTYRLAEGARRPRCAVCRMAIEDGQNVVTCPGCGRVFHQLEAEGDRPAKQCWTYRPACLCTHPTPLTDEAVWRPEQEEIDHV
jgi:hypothetical protein